jgi:DNA-directed RNA polymerase specialized sigma24 family protein
MIEFEEHSRGDQIDQDRLKANLKKAVDSLPLKNRKVLMFRQDGLTWPEIAEAIGKSKAACRHDYMIALKQMKHPTRLRLFLED